MTGPQIAQQMNNWCAAEKTWQNLTRDGCGNNPIGDAPLSSLSSLVSSYTDTVPHNAQTIAEGAYDIWTNYSSDIMVWQDVQSRCNAGSYGGTKLATGVTIGGHVYDVYRYGSAGAEVIFVEEGAGGPGTCAQDSSGTVDLLGVLKEAVSLGISVTKVGEITFTFEICSTGGQPETFGVSHYSIAAKPSS